jgi:hypothetical protein
MSSHRQRGCGMPKIGCALAVRTEILSWNLPHAFLAFGAAAQRVAEIVGQVY